MTTTTLADRVVAALACGPMTVPQLRAVLGLVGKRGGWDISGALKSLRHERRVEIATPSRDADARRRRSWQLSAEDPPRDQASARTDVQQRLADERAAAEHAEDIERRRLQAAIERRPGQTVAAYAAELRRHGDPSVLDWWFRRADTLVALGKVTQSGAGSAATYTAAT